MGRRRLGRRRAQHRPALVAGADWSSLAAALDRAARAGYDVQQNLPRLAAHSPLPEVRPARALHYSLVDKCPAAITPLPPQLQHADDEQRTAAALARLRTEADLHDNQLAAVPAPIRSPVGGALHAAQDRMRAEGCRLDNQQNRSAARPSVDRTPGAPDTSPTRPTPGGDRSPNPMDRRDDRCSSAGAVPCVDSSAPAVALGDHDRVRHLQAPRRRPAPAPSRTRGATPGPDVSGRRAG